MGTQKIDREAIMDGAETAIADKATDWLDKFIDDLSEAELDINNE